MRLIAFLIAAALLFAFLAYRALTFNVGSHAISHHNDYEEVDLKSLGSFVLDPVNGTDAQIPPYFRALDGKRVQLEGFMSPGRNVGRQLRDFQFVYDIQSSGRQGPPLVQERVFAHVPESRQIPYLDNFARITGILHVKIEKEDGTITSVYRMDVESAEVIN